MYEKYFKPFTSMEYHYEVKNCLETAYEEGYAQGLAEVRREAVLEVARKLKARGDSVADIAALTGLAAAEIAALKSAE